MKTRSEKVKYDLRNIKTHKQKKSTNRKPPPIVKKRNNKTKKSTKSNQKHDIVNNKNLEKIYFNIEDVDSYTSAENLRKRTKIPIKNIKKWLNSQIAYSLNRPIKKNFQLEHIK